VSEQEWSFGINVTRLFGGASEEDRDKRKEERKKEEGLKSESKGDTSE